MFVVSEQNIGLWVLGSVVINIRNNKLIGKVVILWIIIFVDYVNDMNSTETGKQRILII